MSESSLTTLYDNASARAWNSYLDILMFFYDVIGSYNDVSWFYDVIYHVHLFSI